jgi:hypothetical protein
VVRLLSVRSGGLLKECKRFLYATLHAERVRVRSTDNLVEPPINQTGSTRNVFTMPLTISSDYVRSARLRPFADFGEFDSRQIST